MSTNGSSNYHSINSSDSISGLIGRESQTIYNSQNFIPSTGRRNASSYKVDGILSSNGNFINRTNENYSGFGMNSGRMSLGSDISNSNISPDADLISHHSIVQGIFNDTKCYDLMQISSKVTILLPLNVDALLFFW